MRRVYRLVEKSFHAQISHSLPKFLAVLLLEALALRKQMKTCATTIRCILMKRVFKHPAQQQLNNEAS